MENHKNSTSFFKVESSSGDFKKIIIVSLLFHLVVGVLAGCAVLIRPSKKPHQVPIIELVRPPIPKPKKKIPKKPIIKPKPKPDPKPEPKSEPKKELPPEVKPEPKKKPKKETPKPEPEPEPPQEEEPVEDEWGEEELVTRDFEPTKAEKAQIANYEQLIRMTLERRFNPVLGRKEYYGKYCTVTFKIYRNGALIDVVYESSGVSFIDDAARRAMSRRVAPLPKAFNGQYMSFSVQLKYVEGE
ncbi:MAG: energy transducer TonB [Fibrobacterales bacterium]